MQIAKLVGLSNGKMDSSDSSNSLELEEYVPKVFSGKLADYAYWKRVWNTMVHSQGWILSGELYLLRQCVPVDVQCELERR